MKTTLKKRLYALITICSVTILCLSFLLIKISKKETEVINNSTPKPTSVPTSTPITQSKEPSPTSTPIPTVEVETIDTMTDSSLYRIVNENDPLDQNYVPDDLVYFENSNQMVRGDVVENLSKLFQDAKQVGYDLSLISGYRTYDQQVDLYNMYVESYGQEYANNIDDKPGKCEHQLGLMIDIGLSDGTCTLQDCFSSTSASQWLEQNAYKYGFIERYPKDKESITGILYSSWNYRYVGIEQAKLIYDSGLTMEEYYGVN